MRISDWSSDVCSSDLHRVGRQLEVLQQRAHDRLRAVGGDLQPHRAQVAAADQLVAQRQRKVLDFLLVDDQLRVAGDAELVRALDLHSREHLRDELGEHRGQENEVMRSEEHTSELQSLMRISYAVFCLKKKNRHNNYKSRDKPKKKIK